MRVAALMTRRFLVPRLASVEEGLRVLRPSHVHISGPGISVGRHVHLHAERDASIHLSTWALDGNSPRIEVGDYTIINPGVRVIAAERITLGAGCMLATGAYISDADWHGLYHRAFPPGTTAPVTLGDNVWVADGARILKGVKVGDNAIVAAAAVVAENVPANTVVAGNPARVVKELDPQAPATTRRDLFEDLDYLVFEREYLRRTLRDNTLAGYLRARLIPRRGD
ncbi:MAG: acyltransferase [Pseudomonadales bacterium]|nr:acyltransferase [Pseudomonadales bacterium]MDP6472992.1 acyltransferase [Pseudomonadales bacterium]MDP6826251.1 acyltransferase [Pseudomonadales bacterium]MDP6970819.1 acyltransferase [Pseudomonadales bacterium]